MSGNGYGYYYPTAAQTYSVDPSQTWNEWSLEQQQQYNNSIRNAVQHHSNLVNHTSSSYPSVYPNVNNRPQNFYNSNNRHYQPRRYNNVNQHYNNTQSQQWPRNNYNKRPHSQDNDNEPKNKSTKKRKKPLSQNAPTKKDWTLEEAEIALGVEKEYNKRFKNHSLIIKFPDQELNREIVSKFHPSIENVHFQQPSTPRFCFVTLQETADADAVIRSLNKIKFGDGFLTAENKKDREDEQSIGPEDIDPCTLYVGNLAQEITKEDMVKTYPKQRRIDIGYAKKMKYTRYAFVSFKNVADSVEAFKKTHSTQMHSKSLIVRFRRLHGTVGMPGESKAQSPPKRTETSVTQEPILLDDNLPKTNDAHTMSSELDLSAVNRELDSSDEEGTSVTETPFAVGQEPILHDDNLPNDKSKTNEAHTMSSELDLSVVKRELDSSDEEGTPSVIETPFAVGSFVSFEQHTPMVIKKEIKNEKEDEDGTEAISRWFESDIFVSNNAEVPNCDVRIPVKSEPLKTEPTEQENSSDDEGESESHVNATNFNNLLNQLEQHSSQLKALRKSSL